MGSIGGGGAAGGADTPASYGCELCDSVYGGPRLSETVDIPLPIGGDTRPEVVFTPPASSTGDTIVAEPVLQSQGQTPGIPTTPPGPPLIFDDPKDPEDPETPLPVPEPATLILTGLGLSGIVARARMRARH
jgi:hypothetical protein